MFEFSTRDHGPSNFEELTVEIRPLSITILCATTTTSAVLDVGDARLFSNKTLGPGPRDFGELKPPTGQWRARWERRTSTQKVDTTLISNTTNYGIIPQYYSLIGPSRVRVNCQRPQSCPETAGRVPHRSFYLHSFRHCSPRPWTLQDFYLWTSARSWLKRRGLCRPRNEALDALRLATRLRPLETGLLGFAVKWVLFFRSTPCCIRGLRSPEWRCSYHLA